VSARQTPWESMEANRDSAYQVGSFWISRFEYITLQGLHFRGLWMENAEGEGMQVSETAIPEGVTPEWLARFWKRNF
jgi:hypothetical protein